MNSLVEKLNNKPSLVEKREIIGNLITEVGNLPPVDCPVTHRFAPGVYLREIFMPKGTIVVGKIHKTEHFNVLVSGRCTVFTVEGMSHHEAPDTFISAAGIQKVVVMHDDCQWQTIHVTDKTDIDEIEKEVIAEDYDQVDIEALTKKVLECVK